MGINLGNLSDLGNLGNLGDLGNLASLASLGNSLLGAQKDGKIDLNSIQQMVQNNPQMIQTMANVIGSAKAPDNQTLATLREALTQVVTNAPAEQVDGELKEVTSGAAANLGGFWAKVQPYLANADKLGKLLPLLSQYAPKALELLRTFTGGASQKPTA